MSESIFVRVQRVVSSGVGNGLDALERVSSAGLMREAIREVDRAADELRAEQQSAKARQAQAVHQQQQVRERLATLEEQARFTLGKGREDLAEAVVARQIALEEQARELKAAEIKAGKDQERYAEAMAALKARRSQMEKELAGFEASQVQANAARAMAATPESRTEAKLSRAEAAFERALAAAGLPVELAKGDEAAKLAEVEALQREAAVAARLDALKAKVGNEADRPKKGRRPAA